MNLEEPSHLSYRTGTAAQLQWVKLVVKSVIVLNLLDAICTVFWVAGGFATEANPLLSEQARDQPIVFVLVKLGLVSLGTLLLWRERRRPIAVVGIFGVFLVYYFILLYHLSAMDIRLADRLWGQAG